MPTSIVSVSLITQGRHKFYSATMDIDLIAATCSPNPRGDDPEHGFQRGLDESRATAIARYIESGGTIPSSIILSAQTSAALTYSNKKRSIEFEITENAFLILDGQHRVYGFKKLMGTDVKYRIPVIIYNELSLTDEARIFIDINTLQKPVPKELLLDIKRLADTETNDERTLDELFTFFEEDRTSFLINTLSRTEKKPGKLSKVTFYDAVKPLLKEFEIDDLSKLFRILNAYLSAASDIAASENFDLKQFISKATLFKILISHSKAVMRLIVDSNPNDIEKISEHKKYLTRSLPGMFTTISQATSYLKTSDLLDRKLIKGGLVRL